MHDDTTDSPAPGPESPTPRRDTPRPSCPGSPAKLSISRPTRASTNSSRAWAWSTTPRRPPEPTTQPATPPVTIDPAEVERLRDEYKALRAELDRSILLVRLLIAILVVLGITVVVLLIR